jgi:glycosyltransferase involved in cell wall biosynthesis
MNKEYLIAVVIPMYRVYRHIAEVIRDIGPEVSRIYVVDDACPESCGKFVEENITDPRVTVLYHENNEGVGGAMITGYRKALADGAEVIVKIDGDGQMDPSLLPRFVAPILAGEADYTKGNRFYHPEDITAMPIFRLFGNAGLSAIAKITTGFWDLFDPTNGYTAIHARVLGELQLKKLSKRYYFELDMLFRLNIIRAVVIDIPMTARYGDEKSNLRISRVTFEFFYKSMRNCFKRISYNYFLRDMSIASFELIVGLVMTVFGITYGISSWTTSVETGITASSGTVMLAALPTFLGIQFLLAFLNYDIQSVPRIPLTRLLRSRQDLELILCNTVQEEE